MWGNGKKTLHKENCLLICSEDGCMLVNSSIATSPMCGGNISYKSRFIINNQRKFFEGGKLEKSPLHLNCSEDGCFQFKLFAATSPVCGGVISSKSDEKTYDNHDL